MSRVLVTGITGSLARLCATELTEQGHEVIGVDYRPPPPNLAKGITFYRGNYNKTVIEDVFRRHTPHSVLHLGRVGNLKESANKRFDLNVIGSAKIMELCVKYDVERLVVLSTFHIYGAHAHNHIPIHEEEPLRAGQRFPQLADAVQLDNQAMTWVYKHPKCKTAVLRPTNIVGPDIGNAIANYLRWPRLFRLIGFDPMWQFVHQDDMIAAILLAWKSREVGVFNVAGSGELPLGEALRLTGRSVIPLPGIAAEPFLRAWRSIGSAFPPYLMEFFRYACVISAQAFRKAFDYTPRVGLVDTIRTNDGGR